MKKAKKWNLVIREGQLTVQTVWRTKTDPPAADNAAPGQKDQPDKNQIITSLKTYFGM